MSQGTVIPHSEEVKRAIRWILEAMAERHLTDPSPLVSEAGARFNLSPADQDSLLRILKSDDWQQEH